MKKLLSLTLALLMVFSLATVAMAEDDVKSSPTVVKVVSGENAPSETYSFTVTSTGMTDTPESVGSTQPAVTVADISYTGAEGESLASDIDLSNITAIGIYNYTIEEKAGNTAGMTYDNTVYTLQVTAHLENEELVKDVAIKKDGVKVESATFTNTYTANTLTVTKSVTGNLGDTTKEFSFTVKFENTNEAKEWVNAITYDAATGASSVEVNGDTVTFTLSDADSITFSNIPDGIKYTVTEDNYSTDGYKTYVNKVTDEEVREASDTFVDDKESEAASVTIINDKTVEVATGITLDSVPFILILSVCAAAVVLFVIKRRNTVEF